MNFQRASVGVSSVIWREYAESICCCAGARCAVGEEIEGDAASHVGKPLDEGVPKVAVQEDAVNENRGGA